MSLKTLKLKYKCTTVLNIGFYTVFNVTIHNDY